jgi:predicted regulator of Ras-like GTPase activity (Roadblock/LC7/MglB family)
MNTRPLAQKVKPDVSFVLAPILELPHVRHAMVITTDGFFDACSEGLDKDSADRSAAVLSTLQAAARSAVAELSGVSETEVRQTIVETDHGYLFLIPTGQGTLLGAYADREVDMYTVTYTMTKQVQTLGKAMASQPRPDLDRAPEPGGRASA